MSANFRSEWSSGAAFPLVVLSLLISQARGPAHAPKNSRKSQLSNQPTKQKNNYNPMCLLHDQGYLGAVSIRKTVLPGMAIPMLKIRRPNGRLIFNMEITIRR